MAKKAKSRIRWTEDEMNFVIEAARALMAKGLKLSSEQRLAKAQAVLPKVRQRPYSANLGSWLNKSIRADAADAIATPRRSKGDAIKSMNASPAMAPQASLTHILVKAGIEIAKGILQDKGVRKALRLAFK